MELELKLILIGLPIVEIAIFIWLLIRKDLKDTRANKTKQNGHMESDDLPGRYMEVLDCEQPYVEYY